MTDALADRLDALRAGYPEEWHAAKEPHDYADGTDHFTHVRYTANHKTRTSPMGGITVEVASYVTSDLGELLCLLHNNLELIVDALRRPA